MALLVGLGAAVGRSAHAADERLGGALPNDALCDRPVVGMQEGRYRNMLRQHTDTAAASPTWSW